MVSTCTADCVAGNQLVSERYITASRKKKELIDAVFWDPDDKTWYDYDLQTQSRDRRFFVSMATPLYTGSYGLGIDEKDQKEAGFSTYITVRMTN